MFLEVQFVNGYWASQNRNEKEWPPSPARLFSALVSRFYNYQKTEGEYSKGREALLWLEKLPPPHIHFPKEFVDNKRQPFNTHYVPINNEKFAFLSPKKQARTFPHVFPQGDSVVFEWPDHDDSPHWEHIKQIAIRLAYLGTSRSICVPRLTKILYPKDYIHWIPDEQGPFSVDCYNEGRLTYLENFYEVEKNAPAIATYQARYSSCGQKSMLPVNLFEELHIFKLAGPYLLTIDHCSLIADALRSRAIYTCDREHISSQVVIGKDIGPHLAYFAFPLVGYKGDGLIYGIGVGIPKGLNSKDINDCRTVINDMNSFIYRNETFYLQPLDLINNPQVLKEKTWTKPSKNWASVTPVECRHKSNIYDLTQQQCRKLNLPPIVNMSISDYPFFEGSIHTSQFVSRNAIKKDRIQGWLRHMKIEFEQMVKGPLSLGITRNFGMGLMKPI